METRLPDDFWPPSLAHLAHPFLSDLDEYVTLAEISSDPINSHQGNRFMFTALVPQEKLDAVLSATGGIEPDLKSWGPGPCVDPEGGYTGSFWIQGPGGSSNRLETPVASWSHHNKVVLLPDNALLMCYGLIPRTLKDGSVSWDDPSKPIYDVVRVTPLSAHSVRAPQYSTARISIRRDYFEDYLSLKGCAAVATYFEERYSDLDRRIELLLAGEEAVSFSLPGRRLTMQNGWGRAADRVYDGMTTSLNAVAALIEDAPR